MIDDLAADNLYLFSMTLSLCWESDGGECKERCENNNRREIYSLIITHKLSRGDGGNNNTREKFSHITTYKLSGEM
jgi:hypothetical protein